MLLDPRRFSTKPAPHDRGSGQRGSAYAAVVAQVLAAAGFLRYRLGDTPYFARNSRLT